MAKKNRRVNEHAARDFCSWLTAQGIRYVRARFDRYGRVGRDGGPWILVLRGSAPHVCILFRSHHNRPSDDQRAILDYMHASGWVASVAYGADDARDAVTTADRRLD